MSIFARNKKLEKFKSNFEEVCKLVKSMDSEIDRLVGKCTDLLATNSKLREEIVSLKTELESQNESANLKEEIADTSIPKAPTDCSFDDEGQAYSNGFHYYGI